MSFLKNVWYVAALEHELDAGPLARKICGEPILLTRLGDGTPSASSNRCPHRFAPLDQGKIVGDGVIQCPYHGLHFDVKTGACVHNPHGDGLIPRAARLLTYPVSIRHGALWIWMGEHTAADPNRIPDFSFISDEGMRTLAGLIPVNANYQLIADNLMDLSHVEYLHAGGLGSDAIKHGKHEVIQEGDTVFSNRWCPDDLAPPVWDALFDNYGKPVDHWLNMRWDPPGIMRLDVGVSPAGLGREHGVWAYFNHFLTPETENSTHYFWSVSRPFKLHDTEIDQAIDSTVKIAFVMEDVPIIERVQVMMDGQDFDALRPVLLGVDTGALRARRVLKQLRERELAATEVGRAPS